MELSTLHRDSLVNELLGAVQSLPCVTSAVVRDGDDPSATAVSRDPHLTHVLQVAKELLLRDLHCDMRSECIITSPEMLQDWLRLYCAKLEHEVFLVLFLDAQHRLIEVEPMFRGTVSQTCVYPREVVKAALSRNAAAVVFAHNHPSGHAEPSRADEYLTLTLKSALQLIDVHVLDHVVVGGDQVVSMVERGLL